MVAHEYGQTAGARTPFSRVATRGQRAVRLREVPGVSDDDSFPDAVGLLDDVYARRILAAADEEPRSAAELAELVDTSPQTVYRRVDALVEADLLTAATRPRSDGHHETVYASQFDELRVRLDRGRFEVSVETTNDAADTLTDLWRRF